GATIVRFRQVIDGLPVDRNTAGDVHVMVGDDGALVAASGRLIASDTPRVMRTSFVDPDDASAVAHAVSDLYQTSLAPATLAMKSVGSDGARMLATPDDQVAEVHVSLARARKAWVVDGKVLIPAWITEAYSSIGETTDGDAYRSVITADGRVIE